MKLLWIISYNTPSMHALVHAEVKNSCSLKWNMNIKHVVTIYNFEMRVRTDCHVGKEHFHCGEINLSCLCCTDYTDSELESQEL